MIANPRNYPEKFFKLQTEIETALGEILRVPTKLVDPDPTIAKAKATMSAKYKHFHWPGFVCSGEYEPEIKTTPKLANRALRIMDTLLKCFAARGYQIEHQHGFSRIYLRKVHIKIKLREVRKQVTQVGNDHISYMPTGILEFSLDNYSNTRWKDSKAVKLEDKILLIVTTIEFHVNELNEIWSKNARDKQHKEEIAYLKELRLNSERKDFNDFKNLLSAAQRWKNGQVLREYLTVIENSNEPSPELEYWLNWSYDKLKWYEPKNNIAEDIFNSSDQNKLI